MKNRNPMTGISGPQLGPMTGISGPQLGPMTGISGPQTDDGDKRHQVRAVEPRPHDSDTPPVKEQEGLPGASACDEELTRVVFAQPPHDQMPGMYVAQR
eukprot:626884-Rhodomonas_salina.1